MHPPSLYQTPSVMAETPTSAQREAHEKRKEDHSPTGFTPKVKRERRARTAKQLFPTVEPETAGVVAPKSEPWTSAETKALLEFLLIRESFGTLPGKWGRRGDMGFWQESASFVKLRASTSCSRTALSCRAKVLTRLSRSYRDPVQALNYFDRCHASTQASIDCEDASTQADFRVSDITTQMLLLLSLIPESEQADTICKLMQELAVKSSFDVPDGSHSLAAMQRLQHAGISNILALLAKAFGATRSDGVESLMPIHRMPVGLIEYAVNFFTSNTVPVVPTDYKSWCETMYSLFGTKWFKIHGGPMWSFVPSCQEDSSVTDTSSRSPLNARINVPAPSVRTIQRGVAASSFQKGLTQTCHSTTLLLVMTDFMRVLDLVSAYHHQSHQVCNGFAEGKCSQDKLQGALHSRQQDPNQPD